MTEAHPNLITDAADAHAFIFGGKARFTLVSKKTGKRFTYRVTTSKDNPDMHFLSFLTGPDNTDWTAYTYVGFIRTHSTHSVVIAGAKGNAAHPAYKAMAWLLNKIEQSNPLAMPAGVEFWHEGRCARCAKVLTDPVSIERGLGPECFKHGGM